MKYKSLCFIFPTIFQWRCFSLTTKNSQNYTYFQKRQTNSLNNIVKSVGLPFLEIRVILAIFSCFSKIYTERNTWYPIKNQLLTKLLHAEFHKTGCWDLYYFELMLTTGMGHLLVSVQPCLQMIPSCPVQVKIQNIIWNNEFWT